MPWRPGDWKQFTADYARQVEEFWNENFTLLTPISYSGLIWPRQRGSRRDVDCGSTLELSRSPKNAITVRCVHVAPGQQKSFRANELLYDESVVKPEEECSEVDEKCWNYLASQHEVGHLLGLEHCNESDRRCKRNPDSDVCYGVTLDQKMDVMGQGPKLSLQDAVPWQKRIARHTETKRTEWKVLWQSDQAKSQGK
jgi:hypothetical protein